MGGFSGAMFGGGSNGVSNAPNPNAGGLGANPNSGMPGAGNYYSGGAPAGASPFNNLGSSLSGLLGGTNKAVQNLGQNGGNGGPVTSTPTPTAANQAAALANPVAANGGAGGVSVANNPALSQVAGQYQQQYNALGSNTDQLATQAMQRERDLTSGAMLEGEQNAAQRGFSADTGVAQDQRNQAMYAGLQAGTGLNATSQAQGRLMQQNLLGGMQQNAQSQAGNLLGQQGLALDQAQFLQNSANFNAQLAAQQNQNQFSNMLGLVNTVGNLSSLGSGAGYGYGYGGY